jgi:NAD(P)-dependent dehydrogenase (short-subunit alcohol dehydrogenase family)
MTTHTASFHDLANKTIAVTGGAGGIGAAIVTAFHNQGSQVIFFDTSIKAGEELASELGERARFEPLDLTDTDALSSTFHRIIHSYGSIDVLVNNAANDDRHQTQEVTHDYWRQRLAVNLDHVFFASQAVVPSMIRNQAGVIINMGSVAWRIGLENAAAYVSAKAAIEGLTHSMARELGPNGIRVNCIAPGAIGTQRQLDHWLTPKIVQQMIDRQCLKALIEPKDVAAMVLVLASDISRVVTNQVLTVDAGLV